MYIEQLNIITAALYKRELRLLGQIYRIQNDRIMEKSFKSKKNGKEKKGNLDKLG